MRLILIVTMVLTGVLAACETTRGVGRDLENTGRAVQRAVP